MLRDADGSQHAPDRADRSNPYTVPDGGGWNSGRDAADPLPEMRGKKRIVFGGWNNL